MNPIRIFNSISDKGLQQIPEKFRVSTDEKNPVGILLRSHKLSESDFGNRLLAIARAGAGVNNVPVAACTEKGIVVFNTPGANANAVKEMVIAGMLMSSRRIYNAVNDLINYEDKTDLGAVAEKIKNKYTGPELAGKTLGIIGLGSIGVLVAKAATGLDMQVIGYDPFVSVQNAWRIPSTVTKADDISAALRNSDYLSVHIPLNNETKETIDAGLISRMKKGIRIMNFSRGELVSIPDMINALNDGHVNTYVTDFADAALIAHPNCLCFPHLGASTPEAEENCAVIACTSMREYLLNGVIINSVNFPEVHLDSREKYRLAVIHRNEPGMIGFISEILGKKKINITDMVNKSRKDIAYSLFDINQNVDDHTVEELQTRNGVIKVRMILR